MSMKILVSTLFLSMLCGTVSASSSKDLPIFDAHIHYSHDVWDAISPEEAIKRLKRLGVTRAMVSSTSDEGTQRLYKLAPQFVIPVLRPYRKRGTLDSWMFDETVIPYLKERLANYRYAAIGEFHVKAEHINTPVVSQLISLAKQHELLLHVHGDAKAVELIYKQYPGANILWAHAGFEHAERVEQMMSKYRNLWADLSFRRDAFGNGQFIGDWRNVLIKYAERFLLGIDTYSPQRWLQIKQVMQWQRELLNGLPAGVAKKIAYKNGELLIQGFAKQKVD
ncbi:MAG: TatD family hydrolase [Gammaproteobacteria bacterium]|nr:TatD family hydrolase [Gammaproteobacteria bacterium]